MKNRSVRCVWSIANSRITGPGNCEVVVRNSWKYLYYLARAKVWVQNSEFPFYQSPSPEVLYINTQHGTPLKKMGSDVHFRRRNGIPPQRNGVAWDYLITDNKHSSEIFDRFRHPECKILEIGYPRNDIFVNPPSDLQSLRDEYRIGSDRPLVLYTPTYREFQRQLDSYRLISELSDDVRSRYTFLVRAHHQSDTWKTDRIDNVIDVSGSDYEIEKLCLISDMLITDYSSLFFDYLYLKKPIVLFPYDYQEYSNYRGLYFDLTKFDFCPVAFNSAELEDSLLWIEHKIEESVEKLTPLRERFCGNRSGQASQLVAEMISRYINGATKSQLV